MARVEIISGPERRRHWTDEQKRAIVAESLAPGAVVSAVWRHEAVQVIERDPHDQSRPDPARNAEQGKGVVGASNDA